MTVRVETIGNATLYLGDCREILPTLPKVDAVITDPPYGMNKDIANDGSEAVAVTRQAIDLCRLACDKNILAFWSAQKPFQIPDAFGETKRIMVWDKDWAIFTPNNVGYRFEYLVWVSGKSATRKRGDIFKCFPVIRKCQAESVGHPTQKPEKLITEIVGDFCSGGTVLDPFMGSGTTGVAAIRSAMGFIGIEADERYFDIACRRISEAQAQQRLFAA